MDERTEMQSSSENAEERAAVGETPRDAPEAAEAEAVASEQEPSEPDDGAEDGAAGSAEAVDEDLAELLSETRRERDEYLELARRARADFENYKRRVAGETRAAEARGKSGLARELVPALDNLERALIAAGVDPDGAPPADGGPPSEEVSAHRALAEGVGLVYRELRGALERAGVEGYDPAGARFDPALHEAIATRQADGVEQGTVLEVIDKGYRLGEQVLRAARVVVSE